MIDNSTKDKLENESPHFGNTLLYAVIDWDDITQRLNKLKGRYFVYLLLKMKM